MLEILYGCEDFRFDPGDFRTRCEYDIAQSWARLLVRKKGSNSIIRCRARLRPADNNSYIG